MKRIGLLFMFGTLLLAGFAFAKPKMLKVHTTNTTMACSQDIGPVCAKITHCAATTGSTGTRMTGYWSSGTRNSGSWLTGDWNTGYRDNGTGNTGMRHAGYWSTGVWVSGYWTTGVRNTGYRTGGAKVCTKVWHTYANQCDAVDARASDIRIGSCTGGAYTGLMYGGIIHKPGRVLNKIGKPLGGDRDAHGCIGAAGFAWDSNIGMCVKPRHGNHSFSKLRDAHDFAFQYGITSMNDVVNFRADAYISRQEAAKMIVSFAQTMLSGTTLSGLIDLQASCKFDDGVQFGSTLSLYVNQACKFGFIKGDMIKGKSVFVPQGRLMKAQALAILMRIVDGKADESLTPWYQGYVDRAKVLGYFDLTSSTDLNTPITRGELILWMNAIVEANNS